MVRVWDPTRASTKSPIGEGKQKPPQMNGGEPGHPKRWVVVKGFPQQNDLIAQNDVWWEQNICEIQGDS